MERINSKELAEGTVSIKVKDLNRKSFVFTGKKTQYFDKNGSSHEYLDDPDCVAKVNVYNGNHDYYVKFNHRSEPYNPHNSTYIADSIRFAHTCGMRENYFRFLKVGPNAFNSYISFLQTKKMGFLNQVNLLG